MPDVCFSSLFFCRITRCQRGGSASRPTQPDRLAILCTWSSKEGGRRSGPARLLLPGKPKKWQLATSEQVVLGLRAEHLDKKQQQLAVLKKSSRAGKPRRAAALRVGRRLNSSALFCSVVSPPQCSRNYRRSTTTVVEWRESAPTKTTAGRPPETTLQSGGRVGGGRGAGWCLGLLLPADDAW